MEPEVSHNLTPFINRYVIKGKLKEQCEKNMGAACSRRSQVTQIKVGPQPQVEGSYDTDELFMNLGRPKTYNYHTGTATATATATSIDDKTVVDVSSTSTLEMEQTTEKAKTFIQAAVSLDKREPKDFRSEAIPDIVARDTVTKDTVANTIKYETPPNKESSIDITKKVAKILDTVIPPESPVQTQTRVGRQSRLMHADLNTVVSYDVIGSAEPLRKKGTKQKKRKGKPALITVKPDKSSIPSPESPTKFHVCKHGIPIVDELDDEEGVGCAKCQRPESRGGRDLQELLKLRRASRRKTKRKSWAKTSERRETLVEYRD